MNICLYVYTFEITFWTRYSLRVLPRYIRWQSKRMTKIYSGPQADFTRGPAESIAIHSKATSITGRDTRKLQKCDRSGVVNWHVVLGPAMCFKLSQ